MHTHINTYIHTGHKYDYLPTYKYIHKYIYIHACIHTYMLIYIHTYIHIYIHTCVDIYTYIHTIHTYVRLYAYKQNTQTYIYICSCLFSRFSLKLNINRYNRSEPSNIILLFLFTSNDSRSCTIRITD